jgi:hypothetical protein
MHHVARSVSSLSRSAEPALGGFHHAREKTNRYDALRVDFLERVRRLLTALVVAQAGTGAILTSYNIRNEEGVATLQAVNDFLNSNASVLREAVLSDPGLRSAVLGDAGLRTAMMRDPAFYDAVLQDPQLRDEVFRSVAAGHGQTS